MFVYVKVFLDQNPAYHTILADTKSAKTPEEEWVTKTWKELADAKVSSSALLISATFTHPRTKTGSRHARHLLRPL